jgi:hypothetical protein
MEIGVFLHGTAIMHAAAAGWNETNVSSKC